MTDAIVPLGQLAEVPDRITLLARADPQIMDLVHAVLGQLWTEHADVADDDRQRFETAIMEVLGNIIEHAYEADSAAATGDARRFQLVVGVTPQSVLATFGDNGQPAELDLSDVSMPDLEAESGRGLPIAMAALDELGYDRHEGRNVWTLVRHRAGA